MRYEVRFGNGYWRVFDTYLYATHSLCGTKHDAEEAVLAKNAEMARRAA